MSSQWCSRREDRHFGKLYAIAIGPKLKPLYTTNKVLFIPLVNLLSQMT